MFEKTLKNCENFVDIMKCLCYYGGAVTERDSKNIENRIGRKGQFGKKDKNCFFQSKCTKNYTKSI